ncbi:Aflatoxin B1 aldehyde reductase member 2 [Cytospora mali]|uniref:Aflatoxin B1 aldehyde reductase member 2 n=1 Tax=Cytospora mali TaxID=578113 RepID=A0A194W4M6_CYTMA|nr:Aflatoxin B1 aldehyde reductase member 2 [Valsa mali]
MNDVSEPSGASEYRVILGLMTCGPNEAVGARITELDVFNTILERFQKRGYRELDTARVYLRGNQEAFTRQAGWEQKGLSLATKVKYPNSPGDNAANGVLESVELSLKELGTDHVDILYLHAADRTTPFKDTLQAVNKLHQEGKFSRFGLSNFSAFEVAEIVMTCKANGWVRPTVYQAMYNVLARSIEAELVPACRRYGLDIVAYNPLVGGLLSGKIKSKDIVPTVGRFSGPDGTLGAMYRGRYFKERIFEALKLIEEAATQHGITMVEIALRWIVHHSALKCTNGAGDGVIIGVSSLEQLESNLDFIEAGPLPEGILLALDRACLAGKADMPSYWHGDLQYQYDTKAALFGQVE